MPHTRFPLLILLALAGLVANGHTTAAAPNPPPAPLNTNAATDTGHDLDPQVTTDGAGNWLAVWRSYEDLGGSIGTDADILVARSINNGATWTAPAALNTNAATDTGIDLVSDVTTDGAGNWVAVWYSNENLGGAIGTDYDVLVARSTDNGATWTAPVALNTNAYTDADLDFRPQLTTDGGGNWLAVWESVNSLGGTVGYDYDIFVSRAVADTSWPWTWTAPVTLNTNADTDAGPDWNPQLTTDGAGNWLAVWRSQEILLGGNLGLDWDILVARSTDNGATWTAPAALNTNAATDTGDDDAPQLATDQAGNWVAVWESNDWLDFTIGPDADILISRAATDASWPWAWTAPTALNTNAAGDAYGDIDPKITTDGTGVWVSVWRLGTVIVMARSDDVGVTWTPPGAISNDNGVNHDAEVITDGAASWVTVWYSSDPTGDNGTDWDILYTTCSPLDTCALPDTGGEPGVSDVDEDNDGYSDVDETLKGSDPLDPLSTPEHCDAVDNDGDTEVDEEPSGGDWDIDGDTVKDCFDDDVDTDGDGVVNTLDDDDDGDGASDAVEQYISTDELHSCPADSGHDAWFLDTDRNRKINIADLVGSPSSFKNSFGSGEGGGNYDRRFDWNADGFINIVDLVSSSGKGGGGFKSAFGTTCTP